MFQKKKKKKPYTTEKTLNLDTNQNYDKKKNRLVNISRILKWEQTVRARREVALNSAALVCVQIPVK